MCGQAAAAGGTEHCIAHGGGRRCQNPGCTTAAQGGTPLCIAHGGGRRCHTEGCAKSAQGGTQHCIAHGGGKRCASDGCPKLAHRRSTFCSQCLNGTRAPLPPPTEAYPVVNSEPSLSDFASFSDAVADAAEPNAP